ncbi:MAG: molecular chaperone [Candidatus Phlomobacter fragariae]
MISKKDMFSRLSNVSRNAPLQEIKTKVVETQSTPLTYESKKKPKVRRKPKNLQIPEGLWEAYESLKNSNTTSLLMTPYILEAFREKLARDGAFDKNNAF